MEGFRALGANMGRFLEGRCSFCDNFLDLRLVEADIYIYILFYNIKFSYIYIYNQNKRYIQ